jgi:tetratricopeptide (TPR) repeat protein
MEETKDLGEEFAAADRLIGAADFDGAVRFLTRVLLAAESSGDRKTEAAALNRIGRSYASLGNLELALRYHLGALGIFERLEDVRGLAETYNHMGTLWGTAGNGTEALSFKIKALDAARRVGDDRELSRAYNNIGEEYRRVPGRRRPGAVSEVPRDRPEGGQ